MNFDYPGPLWKGLGGGCPHCYTRPALRFDVEAGDWYCPACTFRYRTPVAASSKEGSE